MPRKRRPEVGLKQLPDTSLDSLVPPSLHEEPEADVLPLVAVRERFEYLRQWLPAGQWTEDASAWGDAGWEVIAVVADERMVEADGQAVRQRGCWTFFKRRLT